jgi:NAD(P) transhydrogenase subunit alpha
MAKKIKKLTIFVPNQVEEKEKRTALNLEAAKKLSDRGFKLLVEKAAGVGSMIKDEDYKKEGCEILETSEEGFKKADIVLAINPPKKAQIENLKENSIWISTLVPQTELELVKALKKKNISCFSLNLMPRITRAQKMDVLSSQSNLAGYKAVILAADYLTKVFPLMMTAAGTINPAKVIVMGVGVAGLQAIATAKRLGALVEATDIRLATKEQVESLGAKFIEVESDEDMEDEKGYAKEASKEYLQKQAEEVEKRIKSADVVITTALIPGKKAPILVTEKMVKSMPQGSVIVDMAALMGGNCELTEKDKIVQKHGVTIIGLTDLASQLSVNATQMYAKNIETFLIDELTKEDELIIDLENEVVKECLVTHEGKITHEATKELIK